jgi:hypothetical protein
LCRRAWGTQGVRGAPDNSRLGRLGEGDWVKLALFHRFLFLSNSHQDAGNTVSMRFVAAYPISFLLLPKLALSHLTISLLVSTASFRRILVVVLSPTSKSPLDLGYAPFKLRTKDQVSLKLR